VTAPPFVVVCCKHVYLDVAVDPISGEETPDLRSAAMSPADEAALEWALRIAEHLGAGLRAVSAGPQHVEKVLRKAISTFPGPIDAVRVPLDQGAPSAEVASALAPAAAGAHVVICGDASLDRGTGAVPAYLARELGVPQALGLVAIELPGEESDHSGAGASFEKGQALVVQRRLDRGRRERLLVEMPCVISVEAVTARLRRAPLGGVIAARTAEIRALASASERSESRPAGAQCAPPWVVRRPYRPRARVVPPPSGGRAYERVLALNGMAEERVPPRTVRLGAREAVDVFLEALGAWGAIT